MRCPFTRALGMCGILPPMRARTVLLFALLLPAAAGAAWVVANRVSARAPAAVPVAAPAPAGSHAAPQAADATLSQRDFERVRAAVARGEMVPLEDVLADAQRRHAGTVLEVELERGEYEVEILGDDGVIRELEYDARTGALLEIEVEKS